MRIVDCKQYDGPWWEARRGLPTASAFDRIITAKHGEYASAAKKYIAQLIGEKYDPHYAMREEYQTAAMRNGTILEPRVRNLYSLERNCEVQQVGLCLTDDGRFGCSPDSLIDDDGVLELKSPQPNTQVTYILDGVLPKEYRAQCHGHLIVTGRAYCDFFSYCEGLPDFVIRVEADDFTEKMREVMAEFLTDYDAALAKVAALMPPPPPPKFINVPGFEPVQFEPHASPY